MKDCLFCKIANKEIDANIVYEDERFIVFMDKYPDSPGHMQIIPKKHIESLLEMDDETFKSLNSIIKKMVNLVTNKLLCDGVTTTVNYGSVQYIKHYHLHVIPRYKNKKDISNEEIYKILMEK